MYGNLVNLWVNPAWQRYQQSSDKLLVLGDCRNNVKLIFIKNCYYLKCFINFQQLSNSNQSILESTVTRKGKDMKPAKTPQNTLNLQKVRIISQLRNIHKNAEV